MRGEIVKVNGKFAARFKRWYHLEWQYIGLLESFSPKYAGRKFIVCDTYEEAESRLSRYMPVITKIDEEK